MMEPTSSFHLSIKCQLRCYNEYDRQLLELEESSDLPRQEMIAVLHPDEKESGWAMPVINTPLNTSNHSRIEECNERRVSLTNVARIQFKPISKPRSRPTSRIRCSSRARNSLNSSMSESSASMNALHTPQVVSCNSSFTIDHSPMINPVVRNTSPLPIRDIPTHPRTTPGRRRRLRDSSSLAAACFDIEEDEKEMDFLQYKAFHILLSEIISIEKHESASNSKSGGVFFVNTQNNGFLQITPESKHAQGVFLAFLKASVSENVFKAQNDDAQVLKSVVSTSQDSFDMQKFEANAVKKRFQNESIWDKMKRRSARISNRFQEMCVCCEGIPNDEVRPYDYISKDDTDSISNSVESVFTEMELDLPYGHDLKIAPPSEVKDINGKNEGIKLELKEPSTQPTEQCPNSTTVCNTSLEDKLRAFGV